MTRSSKTTRTLLGGLDKSTACGRTSRCVPRGNQVHGLEELPMYTGDSARRNQHTASNISPCAVHPHSARAESPTRGSSKRQYARGTCARGQRTGKPKHTGHTLVFGSPPYALRHPQNAFVAVLSWTCVSSPMTASHAFEIQRVRVGVVVVAVICRQTSAKRASVDEDATALLGRSIPRARPDPRRRS